MFCKNCGSKIEEKSNLCPVCQPVNNSENGINLKKGSDGKSIKRIMLGLLIFFIFSIIILTIAPLIF